MFKYLIFLLLLSGCSKEPIECWKCDVMYQGTDELIESYVFCDKDWTEIMQIADSLNTFGVTYTQCKKQ